LKIIGFLLTLVSLFLISEDSAEPADYVWLVIGLLILFPPTAWRTFTNGKQ
jgi:hypothetical protein